MMNKPRAPHRQLVVSRDVNDQPFAFVPLTCSLYRLSEHEFESITLRTLDDAEATVLDIGALPDLENEFIQTVNESSVDDFYRTHSPGIALVITQSCNLGCSYCLAKQGTFGLPVLKMKTDEVIARIEALFEAHPQIDFIKFFGGEPTLRMDLIHDVCEHITTTMGRSVHFALTTNGTRDPSEHIETWKKFHISVSVSIDGPRDVHDAERKTPSGQGSYDQAISYCDYLKNAEFPFAAVGVFDERHIKQGMTYIEMIRFLNQISPLVKVQFVEALGDAGSNPAVAEFSEHTASKQVIDAVDQIWNQIRSSWMHPTQKDWIYDNNLFRFAYGITKGI